ncbi:hypothetical protein V8G54_009531 [Vigna mungo]|uniref:Uncharacterized protein n=1 Tax=Vigna mungo TaxID=3915 RepID=A0AAQ3S5K3_VIGMU
MMLISVRNSLSPWSANSCSFFIAATRLSDNTPLYTVPPAPLPISSLKPFVACFSSEYVYLLNPVAAARTYPCWSALTKWSLLLNKKHHTIKMHTASNPPKPTANQSMNFTDPFSLPFTYGLSSSISAFLGQTKPSLFCRWFS